MINIPFPEQEQGVLCELNSMRLQSQLCDVTVRVQEREFYCHQAILAASSGHFHSIFVQGVLCFPKKPNKETLDLSVVSADVFSIVLDYIYTASLKCPPEMVADVLQAAKILEIRPLVRQLPMYVTSAPVGSTNSVSSMGVGTPQPATMTCGVVTSGTSTVPESLTEMLTEPDTSGEQVASSGALGNVVVKQEPLDPHYDSPDMWAAPTAGLPAVPRMETSEDIYIRTVWSPWVNDESSRALGPAEVAEIEENCRRCARKDNSIKWCIRTMKTWCLARNKPTNFETLPCDQLCRLLQQFYFELRNPSGSHYGAQTMLGFRSSINSYLLNHPANLNFNIVSDKRFLAANKMLLKVTKECPISVEAMQGIKAVSIPDIRRLFETGTLSLSTPTSLQRLIWFYFTIHFHIKTTDEWLQLEKRDLTLHKKGVDGTYFTLKRPGWAVQDRMYAEGGNLCPVAVTKMYLKKLHPGCACLMQKPMRVRYLPGRARWYKDHPPGQNYITHMMKGISADAELSVMYTNNRICKTTRQDLESAGIFSLHTPTQPATVSTSHAAAHYHSTPGLGSSTNAGAATRLHTMGQTPPNVAVPTDQQDQKDGNVLGSVMQSLGRLPGAGEQQAYNLVMGQKALQPPAVQNLGKGEKRFRRGVRRSTRKRKTITCDMAEDTDEDDDWLSG